ncbi:hypothetical protein GCK72_010211 [Caenorhabditis remanei]|uniref:BTB domain-containing protein n=1 Tax=Caenorhabditis remanei TaxID=31234 RepID=A0A6A5H6F2_CAERE|nr:hypothetical protein GCK72_010211 [Caenorhabditis remanei]KAF1761952.1 hypothetical protein GCK72_010211 [Caenorhabditis remanei]
MNDVYRVWEDAYLEKNLTITRDTNPQYTYVANYLWFFFVEDKTFHIVACFKETPEIEYHASVKIWFKDEHFCHYERTEIFPFNEKKGDEYEIVDPDWESIEVTFRVNKLHGDVYIGPSENESVDQNGIIVVIGDQKVFLNMEAIILQSEVLYDAFNRNEDVTLKLSDVDPAVFFEMLRVLNPPHKRISRFYFTELLLLGCRFRMIRLLNRLDEFSKSSEYDKNWITKVAWKKIQRVLREDPSFTIQTIENFRMKKREEKPVRKVKIRDPEILSVHQFSKKPEKYSCIESFCDYCGNHKTSIIYTLLAFLFFENIILLMWFLCIYKESH